MARSHIAVDLAKRQKEISVAEFFERNKQLLGFDSLTRALLTSVKEAVDNSLDACEEADILPEIIVKIDDHKKKYHYTLTVEDNGPGIVKRQIPNIFGRLLYGSRFHAIRQSRGQQGIGISAVVMYSQLTTGKPSKIISKIGPDRPAHEMEIVLDTKKNRPEILREEVKLWKEKDHGTRFTCQMKGRYIRGKQSIIEYLTETAIVNPHAHIIFIEPDGEVTEFERATEKLPIPTEEIRPHPQGIELGTLLNMAKVSKNYKMTSFLKNEFSRVSQRAASQICKTAFVDEDLRPQDMNIPQASRLIDAFNEVKLMMPPTDCLSPIGEILIKKGMKKEKPADFVVTHTRPKPSVYSGHPFQVEAGLIYGGELDRESQITILRFANRVPLLFQQGGCVVTKALEGINWKRYGLDQKGGKGIPHGPVLVLCHVASTKVPFTSESKEAIANIPDIKSEVELALRACGKKMLTHIRKKKKYKKLKQKETIIRQLLPMIAEKSAKITGKEVPEIEGVIAKIMNTVLIDDVIEYDEKKERHKITLRVKNYTRRGKKFDVYALVPQEADLVEVTPKPKTVEYGAIKWNMKRLKSLGVKEFTFVIEGLEEDDYEESEIYVEGIDHELVSGADEWDQESFDERRKNSTADGSGAGDDGELPDDEDDDADEGSEEEE